MLRSSATLLTLIALMLGFTAGVQPSIPYDLKHPSKRFSLPAELTEVSALTDIDSNTVACLQDEEGVIYLVDLSTGKIISKSMFAGPGDYEGLTRVGEDLYALRSDGLIHHLRKEGADYVSSDTFRVVVPNHNIESLGLDERNQVMLIAAKDNLKGDKALREARFVYGWNLRTDEQLMKPVLTLNVQRIASQARALGVKLPMKRTDKGKERLDFKLRPSSIAMHPTEDLYYLLSAQDRALLVIDRAGALKELVFLDPTLFPKPEGITFQPDGTLLISNEGKDSPPNLLVFSQKH